MTKGLIGLTKHCSVNMYEGRKGVHWTINLIKYVTRFTTHLFHSLFVAYHTDDSLLLKFGSRYDALNNLWHTPFLNNNHRWTLQEKRIYRALSINDDKITTDFDQVDCIKDLNHHKRLVYMQKCVIFAHTYFVLQEDWETQNDINGVAFTWFSVGFSEIYEYN